jgi:hypothetical protein
MIIIVIIIVVVIIIIIIQDKISWLMFTLHQ